jgi:hypothetical protein
MLTWLTNDTIKWLEFEIFDWKPFEQVEMEGEREQKRCTIHKGGYTILEEGR